MFSLDGKTAVIIGGTSGIGLAVARSYAEAGARVAITGRRDARATVSEFGGAFIQMDVTEETSVAEGLATVADQLGPLDIVVITAGTYSEYDTLAAEPSSETRRVIETNLIGAIWCLKHVPSCMRDGGSIVCTGSIAGFGFTTFGYASYASSKAGLDYAARTLAVELGPRSIRVNTISPGGIAGTEMSPPAEFISSINLFGRPGEVDDLMGLFNLLASDASRYITGQNILVDGGISTGYSAGLTTALKASLG